MFPELVTLLEQSANIGEESSGGLTHNTNGALASLITSAFNGLKSGLSNLFTGATEGVDSGSINIINNNIDQIKAIPTIEIGLETRIKDYLSTNKSLIDTFQDYLDIKLLRSQLQTAIDVNEKIKTLLPTIKNIKSFGSFSIERTGFVDENFITTNTLDGRSFGEGDLESDIPQWAIDISQALQELGFISYKTNRIQPINFFVHGGNASGIQWLGVATAENIEDIIKGIETNYQQLENQQLLLEENIGGILAITDTITTPPNNVSTLAPTEEPTLEELYELVQEGKIVGRLADLIRSLVNSISITKTINEDDGNRKRKRKHKRIPSKKRNRRVPQKIKMAWVDTNQVSNWISKLVFTFPTKKLISSDDRGTLRVHLKKGGVITFVRVKRGTFSVMAQVYGTGYRVWSQFWKKRIVNRTVLSWFIKRINAQDREIAIPQEINNKKIQYK